MAIGAEAISIELTNDDKKAFRERLDGSIYEVTRVRLPLLLRLDAEPSSGGATYDHETVSVETSPATNPRT